MTQELFAFLITFREALEASLIIAIAVAYLTRIQQRPLLRYVWIGLVSAISASVLLGVSLFIIYRGLSGVGEALFEGVAAITATVVLTYMIFWMTRHSGEIRGELEGKIAIKVSQRQLIGISALAFIAVFREGVETVLFLTTSMLLDAQGTIIGALVGGLAVTLIATLMLRGTRGLPLRQFFKATSILLIVFAAGIFATGAHEMVEVAEEAGYSLGMLGSSAFDAGAFISDESLLGQILRSLIGYRSSPEWLTVFAYAGYWLVTGLYMIASYSSLPAKLLHRFPNLRPQPLRTHPSPWRLL